MGRVLHFPVQPTVDYLDKTDNCYKCHCDINLGDEYFEWPTQEGHLIVIHGLCSPCASGSIHHGVS